MKTASNISVAEFNTAWKVSIFRVFLLRIFPHSDWIRRDTLYLSVCSPNTGKYGPEKFRIRELFTQCKFWTVHQKMYHSQTILPRFAYIFHIFKSRLSLKTSSEIWFYNMFFLNPRYNISTQDYDNYATDSDDSNKVVK